MNTLILVRYKGGTAMRRKVFVLSLTLIIVLYSSFSVFAGTVRYFPYAEPAASPSQGYLAYVNGQNELFVAFWSINVKGGDNSSDASVTGSMNLTISDSAIQFTPQTYGGVDATYHLTTLSRGGTINVRASGNFESVGTTYTLSPSGGVSEFVYKGNVGIVSNVSSASGLRVNWGTDSSIVDLGTTLDSILDAVDLSNDILDDTENLLSVIEGDIVDVHSLLGKCHSSLDEIVTLLSSSNGNMNKVLEFLDNIIDLLEDVNYNISSMITILHNDLDSIEDLESSQLEYLESVLSSVRSQSALLDDRLSVLIDLQRDSNALLSRFIDLFNNFVSMLGSESTDSLDDSDLVDLEDVEDDVISDESDRLDDLSLSFGNAFDVVWQLISDAWQTNAKVFTVVIMCLTIGVLKLILNR